MNNEITVEMLDRKIAWCEQKLAEAKAAAIQRMQDFYYEKTRDSVDQDWPESFNGPDLAKVLNVEEEGVGPCQSSEDSRRRCFSSRAPAGTSGCAGIHQCQHPILTGALSATEMQGGADYLRSRQVELFGSSTAPLSFSVL